MTVVHLKSRHTAERSAFVNARQSHSSLLFTESKNVEVFELPLSVGDAFCDTFPASDQSFQPMDDSGVRLPPRSTVIVEANELIEVPYNMFGIIFPKGTLATVHGIVAPTTKIDPGFSGFLRLAISNSSSKSFALKRNEILGSAIFFSTSLTVDEPITPAKKDIVGRAQPRSVRARKWVAQNLGSIIVPLIAAIIGGLFTLGGSILTR